MRNKNNFFSYVIFVASGLFLFPSLPPSALLCHQQIPLEVSRTLHLLYLAPFGHHANNTTIANNHHTMRWKPLHMLATPYSTIQPLSPPSSTPLTASRTPSPIDLTQLTPNDP